MANKPPMAAAVIPKITILGRKYSEVSIFNAQVSIIISSPIAANAIYAPQNENLTLQSPFFKDSQT